MQGLTIGEATHWLVDAATRHVIEGGIIVFSVALRSRLERIVG